MFYDAMDEAVGFVDVSTEGWERRLYNVGSAVKVNPRITGGRLSVLIDLADKLKQQNENNCDRINKILAILIKNGAISDYESISNTHKSVLTKVHVLLAMELASLLYFGFRLFQ